MTPRHHDSPPLWSGKSRPPLCWIYLRMHKLAFATGFRGYGPQIKWCRRYHDPKTGALVISNLLNVHTYTNFSLLQRMVTKNGHIYSLCSRGLNLLRVFPSVSDGIGLRVPGVSRTQIRTPPVCHDCPLQCHTTCFSGGQIFQLLSK